MCVCLILSRVIIVHISQFDVTNDIVSRLFKHFKILQSLGEI